MKGPSAVAAWLAALVSGLSAAFAVRYNTFVPFGTDASGYVEAAHRWVAGRLLEPSPLPLWAPWAAGGGITVPLGFRPGLATGTDVTEYPAGLPLLMAGALRLAGDVGPYLVAPAFFGVLVWCAFALGRRLGGPWCGLLAAILVSASPITFGMAVQPMSDVPATALWMLALVMGLRAGVGAAAACGAAVAAAVLVRPNLAPLALLVGVVVLTTNCQATSAARVRWAPIVVAGVAMTTGPLLLMWVQYLLYGGPFAPSYRAGWDWMFSISYIPRNLELSPGHLTALHSPVAFAGLLTPFLIALGPGRRDASPDQRRIAVACLAFAVINFLLYLPYFPYEDPHYLRFQMPAVVCLFVLLAGLSAWLWRRLRAWAPALTAVALLPAAVVMLFPQALLLYPLSFHRWQSRIALMGHYLPAVVPANAVILSHLQSGAMAHYTNLPVVRLDQLPADALDSVATDLVSHGYEPVLLLGEEDEVPALAVRFPSSPLARLDWPPRARAFSRGGFAFFRVADQALYAAGARWPVDVLRPLE